VADEHERIERGMAYVDESKAKDYLLIAAVLHPERLGAARRAIRSLILPGQSCIHTKDERESRRRQLLSVIERLDPEITIYRVDGAWAREPQRRDRCVDALIGTAIDRRYLDIVFELDETLRRPEYRRG
jgi:hypothetical protein